MVPGTRLEISVRWPCSWALSVSTSPQWATSQAPQPAVAARATKGASQRRDDAAGLAGAKGGAASVGLLAGACGSTEGADAMESE